MSKSMRAPSGEGIVHKPASQSTAAGVNAIGGDAYEEANEPSPAPQGEELREQGRGKKPPVVNGHFASGNFGGVTP